MNLFRTNDYSTKYFIFNMLGEDPSLCSGCPLDVGFVKLPSQQRGISQHVLGIPSKARDLPTVAIKACICITTL